MKRIVVTGSSGYLGSLLATRLIEAGYQVLGTDLLPPANNAPHEFVQADIRDEKLLLAIQQFEPDTIVHAAFVVQPIRNSQEMQSINIGGTKNVLRIVEELQPARFLTISSATAYGAHPDNLIPMSEEHPLRQHQNYQYASDKFEIESLLEDFQQTHANICVSWVRPTLVGGPGMNNFLHRFIFGMPFVAKLDGVDTPSQFVHEEDLVRAIVEVLESSKEGAFNVAPPEWTCLSEIAEATNRRLISLPFWLAKSAAWLAWNLRIWIHESPAGFQDFVRYPWVVEPKRLQQELGFEFKYTSIETVHQCLQQTRDEAKT